MDWGLAFIGGMMIAIWIPSFLNPESRIGSVDGWRKRLSELENGAPEAFFEERRQLEAYPPSAKASPQRLRVTSGISILLGCVVLAMAILR